MLKAIYPGSFDPITYGHINIIQRAAKIFDELYVVVMHNINKKYFFDCEERMQLTRESLKDYKNIKVECYEGLLVDYAKQKNINVIIRGLRAVSDFEFELQLANSNRSLNKDIEILFLMTDTEYSFVSSTIVKEVARFNGNISQWVPKNVEEAIFKKISNNNV
ncbi:phosphopantetheine adenylyltransferase [Marinitoga sp. 1135]|uniref:Phosphopantetheine adenylyltransferase n=1 Tax=Marinitoga piezophila (strain DSM 14283 / JCM 11233 / KA3) TaxID=443254 RepID=H2J680_MARPK|nr:MULTISPECIES: pantetheine-phosphate adenylyltransferase [Marinitoga]AEX86228.1 pantetheine-phosphate adenylyltransferase [Marinitoga piezophila KA3]APT76639.1 phosphopantetheine adenylyltransferase [Marinitoga sp. 1137]NUU96413.1 phosphopantetheine adenylyltransferase [Marinitoga sp. 1135]NUU98334.1 phosphopantetheine adenylyltransferase [Marinitoga sp. 1138]